MTVQFWVNNPAILLQKQYILELWPTPTMTSEQKQNAIARLVIIASVLGYLFTRNVKIIIAGILTLVGLIIVHSANKPKLTNALLTEGFHGDSEENISDLLETDGINSELISRDDIDADKIVNPVTLESVLKSEFYPPTKKNPFSNVLLTEIGDKPERKSAQPSFNYDVEENITKNVKKSVQYNNPGIKNTDKQLFGDLYENWELDQSNRAFFSTANTKIQPGDQASFGNYLYGNMPSGKEGGSEGAMERVKYNTRYLLYSFE
jgi:hypothetical protein